MKYVAEGCQIVGDVEIGQNSSIWYNAVLRGDTNKIVIGEMTNIQDNAVLHVGKNAPLMVGNNVTVGHGAILHGCTIKNNVLIGMGAIVLDGAVVEENCIIGAGTLITQNKVIPSGSLAFGNPVKAIRLLTEEEKDSILQSAKNYSHEASSMGLTGEF